MSEPLTATDVLRLSGFTEYRKTALTPISDRSFPPGTVYQTPEGLRAEDEETRCAFDVQGGIYQIRESVFAASYATIDAARDTLDEERLARALHKVHAYRTLDEARELARDVAAAYTLGRKHDRPR